MSALPFAEKVRAPAVQPELRRSPIPISLLCLGRGGDDLEGPGDQAGWWYYIPYVKSNLHKVENQQRLLRFRHEDGCYICCKHLHQFWYNSWFLRNAEDKGVNVPEQIVNINTHSELTQIVSSNVGTGLFLKTQRWSILSKCKRTICLSSVE